MSDKDNELEKLIDSAEPVALRINDEGSWLSVVFVLEMMMWAEERSVPIEILARSISDVVSWHEEQRKRSL